MISTYNNTYPVRMSEWIMALYVLLILFFNNAAKLLLLSINYGYPCLEK